VINAIVRTDGVIEWIPRSRLWVIFDRFSRFCMPAHFRFASITDLRLIDDIAIPAGLRTAIVP
jgi:hypothetical protein